MTTMMTAPTEAQRETFFAKVDRSGGSMACHPWKLAVDSRGYGQFAIWTPSTNPAPNGCAATDPTQYGVTRRVLAHRFAWMLAHGPIPAGRGCCVLHHCDMRRCVNVHHLFLGTDADNVRDMWAKGRARILRGAEHPRAKIAAHVNEIRMRLLAGGESQVAMAREFGVMPSAILAVKKNQNYRHIPWPTSFLR